MVSISIPIPYSFTTSYFPFAYAATISLWQQSNSTSFSAFGFYACEWDVAWIESGSILTAIHSGNCGINVTINNNTTVYYGLDTGISISSLPSSTLSFSWGMSTDMYQQFANFSSLQRTGTAYFYI